MDQNAGSGHLTRMDLSLFTTLGPTVLVLSVAIAVVAGVIKGAVGFAMPLILISGLSSIMEPTLALAALIIPIVVSNLWQVFRTGWRPAKEAVGLVWRYVLIVCLFILITAQFVTAIPERAFYIILGIPVVAISLIQLLGLRLTIPEGGRSAAEYIAGVISGTLGGIAGTWGPPTVIYLLAIDMPKARQMVVQGVIYGAGSVALLAAHLRSGLLNGQTAPFSASLLIPALLGMAVGFRLSDRMDQERFRKVTLVVLVVAGLNLLRKGAGI
ncbi:MAG: sulfite exporter TauE/SafE family protein [Shimia sp.]